MPDRTGGGPLRIVAPDDVFHAVGGSPQEEQLRRLGSLRVYDTYALTPEAILERIGDANVVINIAAQTLLTPGVLRRCPGLGHIVAFGVGVDNIDLGEAGRLGIVVSNTPGYAAVSVAEAALALALALVRRLPHYDRQVRQGGWGGPAGQLYGKTLGVVGTGSIGRRMAALGKALGTEVLAWTYHPDREWAEREGVALVSLEDLLRRSDVVSLHLRLTPQSHQIVGRRELAMMKPTALLVNTARGALVDEDALVEALRAQRIAGAGLDVFAVEPLPPGHPLTHLDNVVLAPHNAADTPEATRTRMGMVVENIAAWLKGSPINRVV